MINIRDWHFLENNILDLPGEYNNVKNEIVAHISNSTDDQLLLDNYVYDRIEQLRPLWKRKHVFYLLRDLLEHHRDSYENFDTTLLEIESCVTGFSNPSCIEPYADEEGHLYDLTGYVRTFSMWLPSE
ncbi:hypothetical protein CJD36_004960 [Flavipsychrobacter stenotrophus]|uniref:Uncharacterized protein n=1 Tax=Flavipsychrobacter stenotrophus TaxID=2077091 RepID=A0A2S7T2V8_9BACT|nr:hypothetical protein [Flavipsychrobacter stenotrophus]PQJ13096.1 hypothetical protein CJD36_004960 [Flavipsychrobacter stenotrophus]